VFHVTLYWLKIAVIIVHYSKNINMSLEKVFSNF